MLRSLKFCLALLLIGAELWTLSVSLWRPHVSAIYRQFYITQQRSCWLPDAEAATVAAGLPQPVLDVAAFTPPQACYVLMRGWNHHEGWGVWTSKKLAGLDVPAAPGAQHLVLQMQPVPADRAQSLQISVADGPWQQLVLQPGRQSVTLAVTPARGDVVVQLRPGSIFQKFGVGLISLV